MKALIATTCIAVLAAVGYYFWNEYSRYSENQAAIAEQVRNRNAEDQAHISGPECRGYAAAAVTTGGAIDDQTKRRLRLCISQQELWPFDRDELIRIGIYDRLVAAD